LKAIFRSLFNDLRLLLLSNHKMLITYIVIIAFLHYFFWWAVLFRIRIILINLFSIFAETEFSHQGHKVIPINPVVLLLVSHSYHFLYFLICYGFFEIFWTSYQVSGRDESCIVVIVYPECLQQFLILVPIFNLFCH